MTKGFIIIVVSLLSVVGASAQPTADAMWDRANTAYVNADYKTAIATYDSIFTAGYTGQKLFYNLGNAYFKDGNIGRSILNYNRALMLDPSDQDVRYNLKIVNAYVKDNIEAVPEFPLTAWIKAWRATLSSDAWAVTSLVLLALILGCVLLYLLSRDTRLRKTGFYATIVLLVVMVFAVSFAFMEKRELTASDAAVVMISAAPVKSSPDNASKDIFILHEGTRVSVLSSLGNWKEITIASGNKGWIDGASIEEIRFTK